MTASQRYEKPSFRTSICRLCVALACLYFTGLASAASLENVTSETIPRDGMSESASVVRYTWRLDGGTTTCVFQVREHGYGPRNWDLQFGPEPSSRDDRSWTKDIGTYKMSEMLQMVDGTLSDFKGREPAAVIERIVLPNHLLRETWDPLMVALRKHMKVIPGEVEVGFHTLWPTASKALGNTVLTQAMNDVVLKHGYKVRWAYPAQEKWPYPEQGIEWKAAARLPELGLVWPGSVGFELDLLKKPAPPERHK